VDVGLNNIKLQSISAVLTEVLIKVPVFYGTWYIDRNVSVKLRPPISGHFKQNRRADFFEIPGYK
jgi:hypothetical protein